MHTNQENVLELLIFEPIHLGNPKKDEEMGTSKIHQELSIACHMYSLTRCHMSFVPISCFSAMDYLSHEPCTNFLANPKQTLTS